MKTALAAIGLAFLILIGLTSAHLVAGTSSPPGSCQPLPSCKKTTSTTTVPSSSSTSTVSSTVVTTTVTTTTPEGVLWGLYDPSTLSLVPWQHIQSGEPDQVTQNYDIGVRAGGYPDVPVTGINMGGGYYVNAQIIDDPLGIQGKVYELTTSQDAQFLAGGGSVFDRVDIWMENPVKQPDGQAIFREGNDVWQHYRIMVPSSWPAADILSGGWTATFQHHAVGGLPSSSIEQSGVSISIRNTNPPQWWLTIPGGNNALGNLYGTPGSPMAVFNMGAITYDHWYDFLIYQKVSTSDAIGFTQLWRDGVLQAPGVNGTTVAGSMVCYDSIRGGWAKANLQYYGAIIDQPNNELSNYHTHIASGNASLYYGKVKVGS